MARHRINKNGHMMWFDSDKEYYDYLAAVEQQEKERKLKKNRKRITVIATIVILLVTSIYNTNPIFIALSIIGSIYITWKCRLWITYISLLTLLILLPLISPGPDEPKSNQNQEQNKIEKLNKVKTQIKASSSKKTYGIEESVNAADSISGDISTDRDTVNESKPTEDTLSEVPNLSQDTISWSESYEMMPICD